MKYPQVHYYEESDSLAIDLIAGTGADASEIEEGIVATFDKDGRILALEIMHDAAKKYPELVAAARDGRAPWPLSLLSR